MVLVLERHPDQSVPARGDEQRAERAVDRAVRNVEQAGVVRPPAQSLAEIVHNGALLHGERGLQLGDDSRLATHVGVHRGVPFE